MLLKILLIGLFHHSFAHKHILITPPQKGDGLNGALVILVRRHEEKYFNKVKKLGYRNRQGRKLFNEKKT